MAQTGSFRYLDGGTFQALELPYQGNGRAMVVLLPKQADGLAALEASLTAENLAGWLKGLAGRRVSRRAAEVHADGGVRAERAARRAGDGRRLRPGRGRLLGHDRPPRPVDLGRDPQGVRRRQRGRDRGRRRHGRRDDAVDGRRSEPEPVPFRADHPFLVLIRDQATGSVLFLGRVVDPKP